MWLLSVALGFPIIDTGGCFPDPRHFSPQDGALAVPLNVSPRVGVVGSCTRIEGGLYRQRDAAVVSGETWQDASTFGFIPSRPLDPNETYVFHLESVSNPLNEVTFTTGTESQALVAIDIEVGEVRAELERCAFEGGAGIAEWVMTGTWTVPDLPWGASFTVEPEEVEALFPNGGSYSIFLFKTLAADDRPCLKVSVRDVAGGLTSVERCSDAPVPLASECSTVEEEERRCGCVVMGSTGSWVRSLVTRRR